MFHTLTECAIKILLWAHMKANMIVYCSLNLGLSICFLHEHPLHFKRQSFATKYVLGGGGVNNATPSSIQDWQSHSQISMMKSWYVYQLSDVNL